MYGAAENFKDYKNVLEFCWLKTHLQAKDTMAKSALPPKLAEALGVKPSSETKGPDSQVQVRCG